MIIKRSEILTVCDRTVEKTRLIASLPHGPPGIISRTDAYGIPAKAGPILKNQGEDPESPENSPLYGGTENDDSLIRSPGNAESYCSQEIDPEIAFFSENIVRIRELQAVYFRSVHFNRIYRGKIYQLADKNPAMGTGNREAE